MDSDPTKGEAESPLLKGRQVVHWRTFERIMDPIWVGLCVYIPIQGFIWASGDGGMAIVAAIIVLLLAIAAAFFLVWRAIKYVFLITDDSLTISEYNLFGYRLKRTQTISRKDIGYLAVDTERICMGLRGFIGIYATRGLPTHDSKPDILFQIRIIYNGWTLNSMRPLMVGAYLDTFRALERSLGLARLYNHEVEQNTTLSWVGGNWTQNMNLMVEDRMNKLYDSLASFEEYVSVNPAALPPKFRWDKERIGGKKAYIFEQTNPV